MGEQLGEYALLDVLGEGGMARVFLAEHAGTQRRVALKVLSAERAGSVDARRSFREEATALSQIRHPNVVELAASVDDHPRYTFHVMQLLQGETLRAIYEREGRLPVRRVLRLAVQIADALAATHSAGFVHRDVKPENVFVTRGAADTEHVTLIDFGAAKQIDAATGLLAGEPIVGTPLYMAPEQMWGLGTGAQTDAYAFALMVYEVLAGELPFRARRFCELRDERSTHKPAPLRSDAHRRAGIPAALERLLLACLERDPASRLHDMAVVAAHLRQIARGLDEPLSMHPLRVTRRAGTAGRYAAVATLFMLTAGALGWQLLAPPPPQVLALAASSQALTSHLLTRGIIH